MWRLEREGDGRRDGAITRREGGERARVGVLAREIARERDVSVLVIPANDWKKRMPRHWVNYKLLPHKSKQNAYTPLHGPW
jgi:hypothetical protein